MTREEFTAAIDAGLEEDPVYIDQMVRVAQVVAEAADRDGRRDARPKRAGPDLQGVRRRRGLQRGDLPAPRP
ncbi:hypothetical protein WKI71_00045 [Streptomyces sp. MS1.AVA.1]|uniref:Uncharacterized protein n=1 Tax=Streptomyces machairae TaxID=3134109 RepID=A0ABU8UF29_9ACTN